MIGLWLSEGGIQLRDDLAIPQRAAGEALIRVRLAGLCGTDLELLRGYRPFAGIPGHEFVGTVAECDEAGWEGRCVVGEINLACGECDMCQRGLRMHCRRRRVLGIFGHDGAFAEYLTLPVVNLHAIPAGVSDEQAVFTEPLAAALEIAAQVHIGPAQTVVVLGDDPLGLLVAQALALNGCRLVAVGHHAEKLAILARRGIETTLDASALAGAADVVVECTGKPAGFEDACRLVRPRGTLALKSTYVGRAEVDLSRLVVDEVTLVGSRCGPFEPALRLLARRLVDVESLIEAVYPLEQGVAAFERAAQCGALKVLLRTT